MNKFIAENNKVFKNIVTGEILGSEIYLAKNDNISNYEQVDIDLDNNSTEML